MNKLTEKQINKLFDKSTKEVIKMGDKTTVVMCKLENGFTILESSSCVDPSNYSEALGFEICAKKIKYKIWELEGYKLQCELYANS